MACSNKAPGGLEHITCHSMVRMVRNRLGMTQEQLARRVGLPQSHIAKIESGQVDIQISTMKRIFKALQCAPIMLPRPIKEIDALVRDRALEAAEKNVRSSIKAKYGAKADIGKNVREQMVRDEAARLLRDRPSSIWNE